ncbi:MAG: cation transporter [Acidobacteria bacterium]|nr:cation transporter [Acidobacteriota bacterium]
MRIEVLYFEGCLNHRAAVERVREILNEESAPAEIIETVVPDEASAQAHGFIGSPTIRIDGVDVEAAARASKEFGMACRTYLDAGNRVGLPPREWIRKAVREAARGTRGGPGCRRAPATPNSAGQPDQRSSKGVLLGASVAVALAASLCCILPIVASVTGLGVFAASEVFEKWRPYLLGFTGLLLAAGFVLAFRDYKKACTAGSLCATRLMNRWNVFALGLTAVLVLGLAAFPYYSGTVAEAVIRQRRPAWAEPSDGVTTTSFRILDMDCPACAVSLAAAFQRLPGVKAAKIDYPTRKAVVTYDPGKQNPAAFEKVVTAAGFYAQPEPHY